MIYECQNCGGHFSTNDMRAAIANNESFIICKYCNSVNEFREMRSSHTAVAFNHLSEANFHLAQIHFQQAEEEAKRQNKQPSSDVYLGQALVRFRVQASFAKDDPFCLETPELICHACNEFYFADSAPYQMALERINACNDATVRYNEKIKLEKYAEFIDKVKDHYDDIKATKPARFSYQLFVAYEDRDAENGSDGFRVANQVRNQLPDEIKTVFLPDLVDDFDNNVEAYEAAILYAINHSNSMLVIADDNIDSRLMNIYSRFFEAHRRKSSLGAPLPLGFVCYRGQTTITLPDSRPISRKNVFDIDNTNGYIEFVCQHNNIVWTRRGEEATPSPTLEPQNVPNATVSAPPSPPSDHPYTYLPPSQYMFGHYPQQREPSLAITNHFAKLGKPTATSSGEWNVLFTSKEGKPYTWFRDDVIDGKKYRAVYFTKYRDVYSVQKSNIAPNQQRKHGYLPGRIYCFTFEPLMWNVEEISSNMAVLISNQGLDCREFNDHDMDNCWDHSTMHTWLNTRFLQTAFDEKEREYLCTLSGDSNEDKVFIIDKLFDRDYYESRHSAIHGSDYYKCIGGMGDSNIHSYWITSNDNNDPREASIILPEFNRHLSHRCVDCTVVAVLPKIYLNLK